MHLHNDYPFFSKQLGIVDGYYNSLPTRPIILTPILNQAQLCLAIEKKGTAGSSSLVRCNCKSKLNMLMKLTIEKMEIDKEVSLRIARRGCVTWYRKVRVCLISQ
jgi:hypothetical protein